MFYLKSIIIVVFFCTLTAFCAKQLERVDDTDLIHLLTGEDNVIALFTKAKCEECDKLQTVLMNIQDDLKESLQATVVKAHESHLVGIYDPSKEPALIYFRRGIPILYYGDAVEDEVFNFFNDNQEPVVKELSDDNFEHLTQASTGSTTGDWFVFYYSADCIPCQRLYAVWEAVGGKLKRRLNVARVNRLEAGASTAKRFGVDKSPMFIYMRHGKFYRYVSEDYTPRGLIEFAEGGYLSKSHPEPVTAPQTLLNDAGFSHILAYLENVYSLAIIVLGLLGFLLVICARKFFGKKEPVAKQPKTSEKTKTTSKKNLKKTK